MIGRWKNRKGQDANKPEGQGADNAADNTQKHGPVIIEDDELTGPESDPASAPPIDDEPTRSNPDNLPLIVEQPEAEEATNTKAPKKKREPSKTLNWLKNRSLKTKFALAGAAVAVYPVIPAVAAFTAANRLDNASKKLKAGIVAAGLATSVASAFTGPYWHYNTGVSNDVCRITEKSRITFAERSILFGMGTQYVTEREPGDKILEMYVVGTENVEGHEGDECKSKYIQDTDWYLNTDSSDLYSELVKGEVYELKSVGWDRNWLFNRWSWAPNIVHADEYEAPVVEVAPEAPAPLGPEG